MTKIKIRIPRKMKKKLKKDFALQKGIATKKIKIKMFELEQMIPITKGPKFYIEYSTAKK